LIFVLHGVLHGVFQGVLRVAKAPLFHGCCRFEGRCYSTEHHFFLAGPEECDPKPDRLEAENGQKLDEGVPRASDQRLG